MDTEMSYVKKDLDQLKNDMALIKYALLSEGELTDYAKKELSAARKEPGSEYTPLEKI
jgi:hypothetical protein